MNKLVNKNITITAAAFPPTTKQNEIEKIPPTKRYLYLWDYLGKMHGPLEHATVTSRNGEFPLLTI